MDHLCKVESMETAAADRYDEMLQPNGQLKCGCGELFNEDEGVTVSPNPWAEPVCPKCFDRWSDGKI